MVGRRDTIMYYCALCPDTFMLRTDYNQHIETHEEKQESPLPCQVCALQLPDSHALEIHATQTGHRASEFCCDKCGDAFQTQMKLKQHVKFPSPCYADASHRKSNRRDVVDEPVSAPGQAFLKYDDDKTLAVPSPTPTDVSGVYCHDCKKSFASEALYSRHCLSCKVRLQADVNRHRMTSHMNASQDPGTLHRVSPATSVMQSAPTQADPLPTAYSQGAPSTCFNCDVRDCGRSFKSEAALKVHKQDSHGIGGQGLDLHGRDAWMLSQDARNQLRAAGVLHSPGPFPPNSRRAPANLGASRPPRRGNRHPRKSAPASTSPRVHIPAPAIPPQTSTSVYSIAGPAEIEQAKQLQDHVMRMLISADIAIHQDGRIVYDGVAWIRIGVVKQDEVVDMCDNLVHLRKSLQMKFHLSHATTFAKDFEGATYSGSEPEHLPEPKDDRSALKVVAICCSKVLLTNGCEEVIKMAAVDVMTGRPLLDYLVCTDPIQAVKDWRSHSTGISGYQDFEVLRLQKFKVLKGWKAARAALSNFADKNTILLGYNLRSDLDALRIVHGRSVDLVKLVEKAADGGAFSKAQLRLEVLLRDLAQVHLRTNCNSGRDCLQDAFAVRELTLWRIKHQDQFVTYARKKSLEYQRVSG